MSRGAACGAISRDYFDRGVSTPSAKALYEVVSFVGAYGVAHRRRVTVVRLRQGVVTKPRTRHVIEHGEGEQGLRLYPTGDGHTDCKNTI